MTNKRYGIAGCGMMGIEHIRNLDLLDGAEVGAVHDPVAERAAQASHLAHGARIAADFDALVDDPDLDALVLVSPNHLHVSQLQRIARGRPRPVLCEKPLYTRPEDARAVEAFAAAYPAPVWVAMEYRYMPPIAALVRDAEAVTGGVQMLAIREHRFPFLDKVDKWNRFNATTGGTFVEKCCHFFDLMRLILRAEPVRVMASAGQEIGRASCREKV
jgi:myo-inositol 2-dehydrogenase / D-chiro-inositol 1-dehydrogenase